MSKLEKKKNTKRRSKQKENILEEPQKKIPDKDISEILPKKYMTTLPNVFKSLLNRSIEIENQEPRAVIELLGECLGISDYKINIASFWFLDTLADQVLKFCQNFNGFYRSIFISWLAGEMLIIKEKNPPRETFLTEMNELFCNMDIRIKSGESLLHWEELFSSREENIANYDKRELENLKSFSKKAFLKQQDSISTINSKSDENEENEEIKLQSTQIESSEVLRAIINATFEMFGGFSRYALIQAAFVEPIEIENFVLPFSFKIPRKIKQSNFNDKEHNDRKLSKSKEKNLKAKKETSKVKKKKIDSISPPPPSLTEEEILIKKREYILPLMESIEVEEMLRNLK